MTHWQKMARCRHEREHVLALVDSGVSDVDSLTLIASRRLGRFRAAVAVRRLISCGDLRIE